MLKHLAIVQIDDECGLGTSLSGSSTLPASAVAMRRLGGKSVVEWLVRRVSDAQQVEGVIVVLPEKPEYLWVADLVPLDVPVHFSKKADPLGRLVEAASEYPCESLVRVSPENPLCDPTLIDRLLITAQRNPNCDYIGYCLSDGSPAYNSSLGLFVEWFRTAALMKAERESKAPADRYQVGRSMLAYPDLFNLRLLPVPGSLNREDIRLSVTRDEDWEHLLAILEAVGADQLDWQEVIQLIDHQPHLLLVRRTTG
jgi:spore coat polysaccharide biosynthesis protein SpsF